MGDDWIDTARGLPPYIQPVAGGYSEVYEGQEEAMGYLPNTCIRIWYTHLPTAFPLHWHDAVEIIYCKSGRYEMQAEGRDYKVMPREILIVPSGTPHTMTPLDGCTGFVYFVDMKALETIPTFRSIQSMFETPTYITPADEVKLHLVVSNLLEQMQKTYFSDNDMRELLIYADYLNMLAQIYQMRGESMAKSLHSRLDKRKEYADIFRDVLAYIDTHLTEDISIDDISQRYCFSRYHFIRLFKDYTRFTFCDYLAFKRVKMAESLLAQPNMSVTDIAYQSGFSSMSTFARTFKKYRNCTPTAYRELYSGDFHNQFAVVSGITGK